MTQIIRAAIIGGTGLNEFQNGYVAGNTNTPFGKTSADIIVSSIAQHSVAFLARHGNPHVIAPHKINYRANLWALKQLGVESVFAVNAVGSIRADLKSGTLVVPDQLIDYTSGRDHSYYDGGSVGASNARDSSNNSVLSSALEHCDFSYPFTEQLRSLLFVAAEQCKLPVIKKAICAVTQGPRLETAAEIDRLEKDGCDIVGMTTMPEAALARELGMSYATLCLVVNPAAGRSDCIISMDEIHTVLKNTMVSVRQLLKEAVALL